MSNEKKSIYEMLEEDIMASDLSEAEKAAKLSRLIQVRSKQVNIMLVGATGSGKSSTINAMFDMNVAKVGVGVDPETSCISKFELDNLIKYLCFIIAFSNAGPRFVIFVGANCQKKE